MSDAQPEDEIVHLDEDDGQGFAAPPPPRNCDACILCSIWSVVMITLVLLIVAMATMRAAPCPTNGTAETNTSQPTP